MVHSSSSMSAFPMVYIKETMWQSPSKELFKKKNGMYPPSHCWPYHKDHLPVILVIYITK